MAGTGVASDTNPAASAKELLRIGQAKYDWSTPLTLVVVDGKAGTYQKWIRGRFRNAAAGLAFRPMPTIEEALAAPAGTMSHLYTRNEHWMMSSTKKLALRLDYDKGRYGDLLTREQMQARSPACVFDFFEDPEIAYFLKDEVEQEVAYRVVTRRFSKKFLRAAEACKILPAGVINSEFLLIPEKHAGKPVYPESIDYYIDGAGYIRIWRSYSAGGELLSERQVVHVSPYEGSASHLFAIPADYTIEIVKNTDELKKALKKFSAK